MLVLILLIYSTHFNTPTGVGLVGGRINPQSAEISLAHNGVLFLAELREFRRTALGLIRQPMEERKLTISGAKIALDFPASFMPVLSMNLCQRGCFNHSEKKCSCPPARVPKCLNRISRPLLDSVDLHAEVTPVAFSELSFTRQFEKSEHLGKRLIMAEDIQAERNKDNEDVYCTAQMSSKMLKEFCVINTSCQNL